MSLEFLGLLIGLAAFGVTLLFGGYDLRPEHRRWKPWCYGFGWTFVAAAIVLGAMPIVWPKNTEPVPATIAAINDTHAAIQPILTPAPELAKAPAPEAANVTPHELANIVRSHTSAQIQRLMQPYIGKLMVVPGTVANVESSLYQDEPAVMFSGGNDHFGVVMRFPREMRERVLSLNEGDSIVVTGKIESIDGWGLSLADCDFKFVKSKDQQPIESTAAAETPAPQATPAPTLVDATPEELTSIFKSHTDAQAQRLVQPYIGKLMIAQGVVFDVFAGGSLSMPDEATVIFVNREKDFVVEMQFHKEMKERAQNLNQGDRIVVKGRIDLIDARKVVLEDCEFNLTPNTKRLAHNQRTAQ
jgi:hypothetical protein